MVRVGILTVSDRSSRGERPDGSGPALAAAAERFGWSVLARETVPDEAAAISACLERWCDGPQAMDLALTTGGTGLGPRDVTPEATRAVLEKELPGFSERMRREGERSSPNAALSRAVCGARRRTLILNLPGSPRGCVESLETVAGLVEHAIRMLAGEGH